MKATILLAEDERDMREVLCDYFTAKSGGELTMISAPDGNTALHLIETQPFDLLLLDSPQLHHHPSRQASCRQDDRCYSER